MERLIEGSSKPGSGAIVLVSAAAVVVLIYGMQAASPILVPFLVAAFLAVVCMPLMRWLQLYHVPAARSLGTGARGHESVSRPLPFRPLLRPLVRPLLRPRVA